MTDDVTRTLTIELDVGYTDAKKNVTHRRVTFGKRLNGKMLFAIDEDPQASISTQYQKLLMRAAITEFGDLKMPVSLQLLLELDSIDLDDLDEAFGRFMSLSEPDGEEQEEQSRGTSETQETQPETAKKRTIEYRSETQVKLAYGYERNGIVYDLVTFGRRLTGMDDVQADRMGLKGLRRYCYLAGQQVVSFAQSAGASALDGPISLETFESLDSIDIGAIRAAAEVWRASFRRPGARTGEIESGSNGTPVS